jgi:S1-C subfamily serine protease
MQKLILLFSLLVSYLWQFSAYAQTREVIEVSSGTGFFVSRSGHIVTNAHVIKNCKNNNDIQFRNRNTSDGVAQLMAIDEEMDLALLKTGVRPNRIATIRWMHSAIRKDENVFLIGYPEAKDITSDYTIKTANIKALEGPFGENKWLQFTDAARQGNSGGPLLDFSGNVVGVVTAKTKIMRLNHIANRQEVIEESDIAITSNELKKFLDKYYIYYNLNESGYDLTQQALANQASSYVVHIYCAVK